MKWIYDDGGRSKYFDAKNVGDCVVRAIAIGTGKDYKEVYNDLKKLNNGKSCRNGTPKNVDKKYLTQLGWVWHPMMTIGSGCTMHLNESELPNGTLIVAVSKHLTCVKNGVLYDTYDCSRDGTRCVYGYWTPPKKKLNHDMYKIVFWETKKDEFEREYTIYGFDSMSDAYEHLENETEKAKKTFKKVDGAVYRMTKEEIDRLFGWKFK